MEEKKKEVNRTIIMLSKEFGDAIPIEEVDKLLPEISKSIIRKAMKELEDEGLISVIDKTNISVNR